MAVSGAESMKNKGFRGLSRHLTFGDCFDQSLVNVKLPGALLTLRFGFEFDQRLGRAPGGLGKSQNSMKSDEKGASRAENVQFSSSWWYFRRVDLGTWWLRSLEKVSLGASRTQKLGVTPEVPSRQYPDPGVRWTCLARPRLALFLAKDSIRASRM